MDKDIQEFFNTSNFLLSKSLQESLSFEIDVKLAEAISRILGCGIYLVDYTTDEVLFISENIAQMCGLVYEKNEIQDYCDYLITHVPDSDYQMLLEINNVVFSFFKGLKDSEILQCCVSYNFHINNFLLHQSFTPIKVENGFVKYGLFILTLSSETDLGHIILQNNITKQLFEYSLEKHIWEKKNAITLSEVEKQILCFAAQGRKVEEIAMLLSRSVDTIKYYKKELFKKLNVSSISEALIYAINNRFF